ncbi:riboflavin synthase [bacterium]|nr:riboflavin synthase [bacterium]
MFTGLIEEIGSISTITTIGTSQIELTVTCQMIQEGMKTGDSVAINGVCLTVVRFDKTKAVFQLSPETLTASAFSEHGRGMKVNLERAVRIGDRLGGHIVQGHVDSLAQLLRVKEMGNFFEMDFSFEKEVKQYLVKKGSVAINGISLTIADLNEDYFRVAIIPLTFKETTLRLLKIGDRVHIETDVLARYVERLLFLQNTDKGKETITKEFLENHGF